MIDPVLVTSIITSVAALGAAGFALRGKNAEIESVEVGTLTVAQQGFIDRIQNDNLDQRKRIVVLSNKVDQLLAEIAELRAELAQTRADLASERAARNAGEDAGKLRQQESIDRITSKYGLGGVNLDDENPVK